MSIHRRCGVALVAGLTAFVLAACDETPIAPTATDGAEAAPQTSAGHGGPTGAHSFQLNIIGVDKELSADMTGDKGRRIFVPLEGKTKIYLEPGDDFEVLDANGTDGEARFQLPEDVSTEYEVWIRPLGKPGGSATLVTCAEDPEDGEEVCSTEEIIVMRTKGKNPFTNVTDELLFLHLEGLDAEDGGLGTCLDEAGLLKGNGTAKVPLFHDCLENYFWQYDNNGLRLLQVRFYPVAD